MTGTHEQEERIADLDEKIAAMGDTIDMLSGTLDSVVESIKAQDGWRNDTRALAQALAEDVERLQKRVLLIDGEYTFHHEKGVTGDAEWTARRILTAVSNLARRVEDLEQRTGGSE